MNAKHTPGFTLVEQLAVLAVMAVLVTVAIPPMAGLFGRSATRSIQHALFSAARLARTQAIMHGVNVLLCPSHEGQHCGKSGDWAHGWIVATDANRDGQPDGVILHKTVLDGRHVNLVGSSNRTAVRFQPNGSAAGTNITLIVCPRHARHASVRSVIISNGGRIREAPASEAQQRKCTQ